jgi:hypothetical protein
MVITDSQVEEIALLGRLTGMTVVSAAYAVIPDFNHTSASETADLIFRLVEVEKRLDKESKKLHGY